MFDCEDIKVIEMRMWFLTPWSSYSWREERKAGKLIEYNVIRDIT